MVIALCLTVSLVPLALWKGLYEYELLPKFLTLHLGIVLCCLGWLIRTGWGRNARLSTSPLTLPATCYMGACLLSSVSTTHPLGTLVELADQAVLIILFFVVACALPRASLTPVWWAASLTGLAVAAMGILQYHGLAFLDIPTNAPPSATFANRNLAAEYLICVIPIAGMLFLSARSRAVLIASGLSASLMSVYLVYTRTRSAWVGLVGALVMVIGLLSLWPALRRPALETLRPRMDRPRRIWASAFLLLFLALAALSPYHAAFQSQGLPDLPEAKAGVGATAASIFQGDAVKDAGIRERLIFWRATLRMVLDHPLLGVGPGGWIRTYPPYDGGATITPQGHHTRPHNDYLWIASENGLIGLGVYLWFLVIVFRCLLKMARNHDESLPAIAFALSLTAILIAACFGFPKEQPATTLFPYLIFGVIAGATDREQERGQPSPLSPWEGGGTRPHGSVRLRGGRGRGLFCLVPFLCLLVSLGTLELTRRRIEFDSHYLYAASWSISGKNWPAVLPEVQSAVRYGAFLPDILFYEGLAFQNLGRYPEAEAAYRQMLAYTPHAWYAHEGLGLICIQENRLDEGLSHLQTALSICPSAIYNRNNIGVVYQRMGRMDLAEQEFRAALTAEPDNPETLLNLGSVYRLRGRLDSAIVHYQHALRTNPDMPQAHLNLAQILLQQGRFQDALTHYRKTLRADPDNLDAQWGLGLALEAGGHPSEAEAAYRKVQTLQPAFPQVHLALASLIYAQGRYREALQAYQSYLGLAPGDTAGVRLARAQIAQCEEKLKK